MSEPNRAVVIHNGSYNLQSGFGGDSEPKSKIPTLVGRPRHSPGVQLCKDQRDSYVGSEALRFRGVLNLKYPIENGLITNWDDIEKLWNNVFYKELEVAPEDHCTMLSISPNSPISSNEKMMQIMFETFNVPALHLSNSALLSLYTTGNTTGVVLDSGHNSTNIVPIYNGEVIKDSITTLPFGGSNITEQLNQIINSKGGQSFSSFPEREIIRNIKETLGEVSLNYDNEMDIHTGTTDKNYVLPDGQIITIGKERYTCVESLFQPSLMSIESIGIAEAIHSTIMKCDINKRFEFYRSIILSGGNTMFNGIQQRLTKELSLLAPSSFKIKVDAPTNRNITTWLGGSILSSLGSFQYQWTQKQDYDEAGPSRRTRKIF